MDKYSTNLTVMACLGVEPGAAGWKGQTNPLSYGGNIYYFTVTLKKIYLKIGVMNFESSDPQLMAK